MSALHPSDDPFLVKLVLGRRLAYRDERVIPVIERFMTGFAAGGHAEFVAEFSDPTPAAVMASVLGLAWDDPELLLQWKAWDHATLQTRSRFDASAEVYAAARQSARELHDVLLPTVLARREDPQDDFISQLWECVPRIIDDCTPEDVLVQCRQLFQGGSQTTTHLMNNAAVFLFGRPELWARLRERPHEVDPLRRGGRPDHGVFQLCPRVAVRDTVLGGREIHAGDRLYVILPARFACPFEIDLDGPQRRRHLAFGSGPRICGGMALARLEVRETVRALLASIDSPRFDIAAAEPSFQGSGIERLAAAFRRVRARR